MEQRIEACVIGESLGRLFGHDVSLRVERGSLAEGTDWNSKRLLFTNASTLYDEAKSKGWMVVSMKNDWNRVFT